MAVAYDDWEYLPPTTAVSAASSSTGCRRGSCECRTAATLVWQHNENVQWCHIYAETVTNDCSAQVIASFIAFGQVAWAPWWLPIVDLDFANGAWLDIPQCCIVNKTQRKALDVALGCSSVPVFVMIVIACLVHHKLYGQQRDSVTRNQVAPRNTATSAGANHLMYTTYFIQSAATSNAC